MNKTDQIIINSVINWFEKAVLGLNLCPFAAKPYRAGSINFELSDADTDESCLTDLYIILDKLDQHPEIETLLLILPQHLLSFSSYNQFLTMADELLEQEGWSGIYQVASFHPDYQFADTDANDWANWTNRSPFPLLHLIREQSITQATQSHPAINEIPSRNVEVLRSLNDKKMEKIFDLN